MQDLALKIIPVTTAFYLETRENFFSFSYSNRLDGSTKYMRFGFVGFFPISMVVVSQSYSALP